jgi:hypothetical protein
LCVCWIAFCSPCCRRKNRQQCRKSESANLLKVLRHDIMHALGRLLPVFFLTGKQVIDETLDD